MDEVRARNWVVLGAAVAAMSGVVTPLAMAGEVAPTRPVTDRAPAVVQVDGQFTAEQSAELVAFLNIDRPSVVFGGHRTQQ
jgi:hypothetical protein